MKKRINSRFRNLKKIKHLEEKRKILDNPLSRNYHIIMDKPS